MYTTIVLLVFIAFLFLYNTSKKSRWEDKPNWASHFEKNKLQSVAISVILMILACTMLVYTDGATAGLFSFMVILMATGNVIVLLFPFRYFSISRVLLLFVVFIAFEQLIF